MIKGHIKFMGKRIRRGEINEGGGQEKIKGPREETLKNTKLHKKWIKLQC